MLQVLSINNNGKIDNKGLADKTMVNDSDQDKKGKHCVKKRVWKIITLKEYAKLQQMKMKQSQISGGQESNGSLYIKQADNGCIEGDKTLNVVL